MIHALFFFFLVSVTSICIREGIRGLILKKCRVPFKHNQDSIGFGIEALIWGGAYLAVGMLYLYFTFESVAALAVRSL